MKYSFIHFVDDFVVFYCLFTHFRSVENVAVHTRTSMYILYPQEYVACIVLDICIIRM